MALGDIVRNFLKSNLNDQLSELEKRTNLQITKMRSGGGSGDIEDTEKVITDFVQSNLGSSSRVLMWEEESVIYLGTVQIVDGVAELHYISIQVGK